MTTRPLRILCLPGSLRSGSWNRRLLQAAATCVPSTAHVEVYPALGSVPLFDEDLESAHPEGPAGVRALRAAVMAADGLVIATPEYNHALPGVLKNALDWLSRDGSGRDALSDLPVGVLGASSGPWGTRLAQASLRQVLHTCGALVMPSPTLFVANAAQRFDAYGTLADPALEQSLGRFMGAFCDWIARVMPLPESTRMTG